MVLLVEQNISTDREMLEIMGLVDPILNFQKIINYRNNLIQKFIDENIDIFIGIDAPDFNFEIHKKLQKKVSKLSTSFVHLFGLGDLVE